MRVYESLGEPFLAPGCAAPRPAGVLASPFPPAPTSLAGFAPDTNEPKKQPLSEQIPSTSGDHWKVFFLG